MPEFCLFNFFCSVLCCGFCKKEDSMSTLSSLITVNLKSAYVVTSDYLKPELAAIPLYFSCESLPKISKAALKAMGQTSWGGMVLEKCCLTNFCSAPVEEVLVETRLKPENFNHFIQYAKEANLGSYKTKNHFKNMIEEAIKKPLVFDFVFKHAASGILHSDSSHRDACFFLLKQLISKDPNNSQFPSFFSDRKNGNWQMTELKRLWQKGSRTYEPIKEISSENSSFLQKLSETALHIIRYTECLYYYNEADLWEYLFVRPSYCTDYGL